MSTKLEIVQKLVPEAKPRESGEAYAPANIALCKYWGKRDEVLNLPVNSSLSISLADHGAHTRIKPADQDRVTLNDTLLARDNPFAQRILGFLDLFRSSPDAGFDFSTRSTIPVAAGLASSASGFAAAVLALNDLHQWKLPSRDLSILSRLGSGSASRSVYDGFAEWHAGTDQTGMDSFAEPLKTDWQTLRVGLLTLSGKEKPIGSREGMKRTVETSSLYKSWPEKAAADLDRLKKAIELRDFETLGATAESNALAMHATMIDTQPPVLYWLPESLLAMRRVWELRADGLPVYFTMDAGPNLKLLFESAFAGSITAAFPEVEVVNPFR